MTDAAHDRSRTIGLHAQLACVWEATARKVGNVHRGRDFADLSYVDFLAAAAAIAAPMQDAGVRPLGQSILAAVRATRGVAATNVNLGIILLLAPLAAARARTDDPTQVPAAVARVLDDTTVADARDVYAAIRLAEPGGLGEVDAEDVRNEPTVTLKQAMILAADRDRIAAQYASSFRDVFGLGVAALGDGLARHAALEPAIVECHLKLLAAFPDSLIARKRGAVVAEEASRRARAVLDVGWPEPAGAAAFEAFDAWCDDSRERRNPGTSADLVAASLFAALSLGIMTLPLKFPWSRG